MVAITITEVYSTGTGKGMLVVGNVHSSIDEGQSKCDSGQQLRRRQMDEEIRKKILSLLDQHRIMRLATLRPDGWPQTTTVGYVHEGLTLYFLCAPDSQKAANLT